MNKHFFTQAKISTALVLLFVLFSASSFGQQLTKDELEKCRTWPRFTAISRFYSLRQGALAWVGQTDVQNQLITLLRQAPVLGLNESDYQPGFFESFKASAALTSRTDSVEAELRFTDAALHFFSEVKNGSQPPAFRYTGLKYVPGTEEVEEGLAARLAAKQLPLLLADLQPQSAEYVNALAVLQRFRLAAGKAGFTDVRVASTKMDSTNRPLLLRFVQLGLSEAADATMPRSEIAAIVRKAQQLFDLTDDGKLGSATLAALNVPLVQRVESLRMLLNTLRWLNQLRKSSPFLVLNLPAASFFVYEKGEMVLHAKVIAGKPSTPTPALTSTITEVILYPYWMVPHKIATRELLPKIRRNIGYLESGNYQVLNQQGRVLNPYRINWRALGPGYFPYIIRQSTGCDNALGIVKFNFYNPFTVYLHDTPTKDLFAKDRRFFSHGCMRVEKPVELARYLLGFNRIAIDTLTAKGCLEHRSPLSVPVARQLPVVILYSTAWYNKDGEVRLYEDVYRRMERSPATKTVSVAQQSTGTY